MTVFNSVISSWGYRATYVGMKWPWRPHKPQRTSYGDGLHLTNSITSLQSRLRHRRVCVRSLRTNWFVPRWMTWRIRSRLTRLVEIVMKLWQRHLQDWSTRPGRIRGACMSFVIIVYAWNNAGSCAIDCVLMLAFLFYYFCWFPPHQFDSGSAGLHPDSGIWTHARHREDFQEWNQT